MADNKLRSLRMLWNVELDDDELASALEMTVEEWRQLAWHAGMGLRCMEAWYVPTPEQIKESRDAIKASWTQGELDAAQKRALDGIMRIRSVFTDGPSRAATHCNADGGTGHRDPR